MRPILLTLIFISVSYFLFSQTWVDCCWKKSETGLEYKIEKKGKGKKLKQGDSVSIQWIWYECETGEIIEDSKAYTYQPRWAVGSGVFVKGFEEGFRKLKKKGESIYQNPTPARFWRRRSWW